MVSLWNKIGKDYNRLEWFCMKLALLILWAPIILDIIRKYSDAPLKIGVCSIFPCNFLIADGMESFMLVLVFLTSILYLFEIKMALSTAVMFVVSLVVFSIEESNGVLERRGLLTFIFFAQFIAYVFSEKKRSQRLSKNRVQFSIQVIAIGYTLSALSKLLNSGWHWVLDGKNMALQILKSFHYQYVDAGNIEFLSQGTRMADSFGNNEYLIYICLSFALLLESFALISVFNKKTAFIYGILLLMMHWGIEEVMAINITAIVYPMIIFMLNPIYLAVITLRRVTFRLVNFFS